MDLAGFALNLAGGAMLGIAVGHAGMMLIPNFGATPADVKASPATAVGKQVLETLFRLGVDIFALAKLSEFVLPAPGNNDPTNGAMAFFIMLHSDKILMSDISKLNSMVHTLLMNAESGFFSAKEVTDKLKDEEDKITKEVSDYLKSNAQEYADKAKAFAKSFMPN